MGQFADRTWHHKLARWYLRRKQMSEFAVLTRDVAKVFAGTDLERYFGEVVEPASLDAVLYRQVNLYAHERFPHNLVFVRNLLSAYTRRGTADPAAWERLIRNHWFYEESLRARFFEFLSRTKRLDAELQAARALSATPVVERFVGDAEIWQCHFESAAPRMRKLAEACRDAATRLERSGAGALARRRRSGVRHRAKAQPVRPAYTATLARLRDPADRDDFTARAALVESHRRDRAGKPAFWKRPRCWDYFYDDALAQIGPT
jgi:hypothetical protein